MRNTIRTNQIESKFSQNKEQLQTSMPSSSYNSNCVEERKSIVQTKQVPFTYKAGSLSRRQNVLPQMTQRVLKKNLILCKLPIQQPNIYSFQGVPSQQYSDLQFSPQPESNDTSPKGKKSTLYDQVYFDQNGKLTQFSPLGALRSGGHDQLPQSLRQEFEQKVNKFLKHKKSQDGLHKDSTQANQTHTQASKVLSTSNNLGQSSLRNSVSRYVRTQTRQHASKFNQPTQHTSGMKMLDTSNISNVESVKNRKLFKVSNQPTIHQSPLSKLRKSPLQKTISDLQDDNRKFGFARQQSSINNKSQNGSKNMSNLRSSQLAYTDQRSKKKYYKKEQSTERLETRESTHDMKENIIHQNLKNGNAGRKSPSTANKSSNKINYAKAQSNIVPQLDFGQVQLLTSESSQCNDQIQDNVKEIGMDFFNAQLNSQFKEISFSMKVVMLLVQYNIEDLPKLQRLNASWHTIINDCIEEYTNLLENQFIKQHSTALSFMRSYMSATPITFCNKQGMRLDRMFQCEIMNNPLMINQTVRIAYNFQYMNKSQRQRFSTEYRFDVIKKGTPRITWIHQSDELPTYTQNEIQMSPGDSIEVAVCLYNMNGLVDLETLQWEPIEVFNIPQIERNPLTYNRDYKLLAHKNDRKTKVHCNINRICEVEDAVPEWLQIGKDIRDQPKMDIDIEKFKSRFNVLDVRFNELDQHYNKITLQTIRRGIVENNILSNDIVVQIKGENEAILNEIKKKGVMFDRNKGKDKIQVRVGDILVLYNSIRVPLELQPEIIFPQSIYNSKASQQSAQKSSRYQSNADHQ